MGKNSNVITSCVGILVIFLGVIVIGSILWTWFIVPIFEWFIYCSSSWVGDGGFFFDPTFNQQG